MIHFRPATQDDMPGVVALLADDILGRTRERQDLSAYHAAFRRMAAEGNNHLIVGAEDGHIVATYQITFISGLSLKAARRAQVESVRVAAPRRGAGIGQRLMEDAEARARAEGCTLMQLMTNATRTDAHRFYDRLGFTPSHIGYKRDLS